MLTKIHLHGELGARFMPSYDFHISSAAEGVRALCYQVDGFKKYIQDKHLRIVNGECDIGDKELHLRNVKEDLHIIPVIEGSGGGNGKVFSQILLGAALIGTSFIIPGGGGFAKALAGGFRSLGASLSLGGVHQLINAQPAAPNYEEDRASSSFDGPRNKATYGVAVPVVYGEVITGGLLISSQLDVDNEKEL